MFEAVADALPLQGKRILVTRTREQAAALSTRLGMLGATPVEFPAIRIVPPRDWASLDAAFARLYRIGAESNKIQLSYSWLIFTSANAVRICCERMRTLGYNPHALRGVRIAAIGPATAAALTRYGFAADLVPDAYVAESVATAIIAESWQRGESLANMHILLPRAAEARDVLTNTLREAGAIVDEIPAYTTLPAASDDEASQAVLAMLRAGQIDAITFTSSSTVRYFMRWLSDCLLAREEDSKAAASFLRSSVSASCEPFIACIGPITAQTAHEHGLDVRIEAATFTIDGLVSAIVNHFRSTKYSPSSL